jgi:hypothetical protein
MAFLVVFRACNTVRMDKIKFHNFDNQYAFQFNRKDPFRLTSLLYIYNSSYIHIYNQRLINYINTKAKCRHLKKLTCVGTLRQVFIKVDRLLIHSVIFVFSTQLCELLPL